MKVKTDEIKHSPSTHTCCKDSRPCPTVSQYKLDALVTQDTRHLCLTQPPPDCMDVEADASLQWKDTLSNVVAKL